MEIVGRPIDLSFFLFSLFFSLSFVFLIFISFFLYLLSPLTLPSLISFFSLPYSKRGVGLGKVYASSSSPPPP
jgi:hypothetical protein